MLNQMNKTQEAINDLAKTVTTIQDRQAAIHESMQMLVREMASIKGGGVESVTSTADIYQLISRQKKQLDKSVNSLELRIIRRGGILWSEDLINKPVSRDQKRGRNDAVLRFSTSSQHSR